MSATHGVDCMFTHGACFREGCDASKKCAAKALQNAAESARYSLSGHAPPEFNSAGAILNNVLETVRERDQAA